MLVSRCSRKLCGLLKKQAKLSYNQNRSGFIVLLPEIDAELAEKLLAANEELPAFSTFTTEKLGTLMGKQIVDYECQLRSMDRRLEDSPELFSNLFEDVLDPLEKITCSFDTVWGIIKTLYFTDGKVVPPAAYHTLLHRVTSARGIRYYTEYIYDACKKCDKSKLTEEQARLVDKHVIEGSLNALDATPQKREFYTEETKKLIEKMYHFKIRLDAARAQFYVTIDNSVIVGQFPKKLLQELSTQKDGSTDGPWTVKLRPGVTEDFIKYCPDRDLRWLVWAAEDKVASFTEDNRELNNSLNIEEIRHTRGELAKVAGHKNYFEANLQSKMATSMESIDSTLNMFLETAKPSQFDEIVELQEFAQTRNFTYPIQLWDVDYWARIYKQEVYRFDDEKLRNFLPLENVLKGLFDLCNRLFNIRIQEVKNIDVWHPDVRFYNVYEQDGEKPVAGFYLDPYERDYKTNVYGQFVTLISMRNSCRTPRPVLPLTSLILNLPKPEGDKPGLMSFSEARMLFAKFGHNLQYLLCKSSYGDIAGLNFVEYDAVGVCSNFMKNWIYEKEVFNSINGHYKTGEKLTDIDLINVRNHLAGYRICKELYKARLDIIYHKDSKKFWADVLEEEWDNYFVFPLSTNHSDPCKYVDVFGPWGAAYYSHVWSDMLASDIYQAFHEDKADVANLGARFKDTFFTFGGACHSREVFRRFRGRDPKPVALLEHYGLAVRETVDTNNEEESKNPDVIVTC